MKTYVVHLNRLGKTYLVGAHLNHLVVGAHLNRLGQAILMSTHNIGFYEEISQIMP